MPLNLFIIGPSGCGKSTQAKLIAQKYQLTHYSMGQLLRDQIAANTDVGQKAKVYMDQGIPVPDEITCQLLSSSLQQINNQNFIVDGFPRLLNQGQFVDEHLLKSGSPTSLVIHLQVDFLEILKRRQKLGDNFQENDRSDNTPEAIANRQKILYESNIAPILDYYRQIGKLFEVDGNRPIEPIFEDIVKQIDKLI
jgi:adenylate kinase